MSEPGKEGSMSLAVFCVVAIIVLALVVLFIIGPRWRARMAAAEPAPPALTVEQLRRLVPVDVGTSHSYIPLPYRFSERYPDDTSLGTAVMEVVDGFERKYPDRQLINWKTYERKGDLRGIWVDYELCKPD